MKISIFNESRVNQDKSGYLGYMDGVEEVKSLEEFAWFLCHAHTCCGIFEGNKRCKAAFKSIDYIQYDFDNGSISSSMVNNQLKQISHIILASKNHLVDKNDGKGIIERYHVFILLDKSIDNPDFYKYLIEEIKTKYKWCCDDACSDVTRYFYKHKSILCNNDIGKTLDTSFYKYKYELNKATKEVEEKRIQYHIQMRNKKRNALNECNNTTWNNVLSPLERFKRSIGYDLLTKEMHGTGKYGRSNQLIGIMKKCGLTLPEALELFDKYDGDYGKSYNHASIEQRWNKFS